MEHGAEYNHGGMALIRALEKLHCNCGGNSGNSGNSSAAMSDITINIDPDNRTGRLFGLLFDTLGGTYRLELTNCRLLSIEDQDDVKFFDNCDGISIPSVIVPLATLGEFVGGASVVGYSYEMRQLISLLEDNQLTLRKVVVGESMFIQSGSLITYCVLPIDVTTPCQLHFVKLQENGRVFNLQRYIENTVTCEYDLQGGTTYRIKLNINDISSAYITHNGHEYPYDNSGVIECDFTGEDTSDVKLVVCKRCLPFAFGINKNGRRIIDQVESPLTQDLIDLINDTEVRGFWQTSDYDEDLSIDRLSINCIDMDGDGIGESVRICANINEDFNLYNGIVNNVYLELHGIENICPYLCLCGTGGYLILRGEYNYDTYLYDDFESISIIPSQIHDGNLNINSVNVQTDFEIDLPVGNNFYTNDFSINSLQGGAFRLCNVKTGSFEIKGNFNSITIKDCSYNECYYSEPYSGCLQTLDVENHYNIKIELNTDNNLASVRRDRIRMIQKSGDFWRLYELIKKLVDSNGLYFTKEVIIDCGSDGNTSEWLRIIDTLVRYSGRFVRDVQPQDVDPSDWNILIDLRGISWAFNGNDITQHPIYQVAMDRCDGIENITIMLSDEITLTGNVSNSNNNND